MTCKISEINRKTQGFSLIELLISMTLMTFLIMGTAQLICHSLLVKCKSDCSMRAAELACAKLEQLRSLIFTSPGQEELQSEIFRDVKLNQTFIREWNSFDISPDMKKIEMSCFAQNHPRKKMRVILILTRELGF